MRYKHSLEIHERIEIVLRLIETGRYSTPALAEQVGVSIPTISRIVAALRERGHDIQAERTSKRWRYVLVGSSLSKGQAIQPQATVADRRSGSHDY
jgi:biotin operon repressor